MPGIYSVARKECVRLDSNGATARDSRATAVRYRVIQRNAIWPLAGSACIGHAASSISSGCSKHYGNASIVEMIEYMAETKGDMAEEENLIH